MYSTPPEQSRCRRNTGLVRDVMPAVFSKTDISLFGETCRRIYENITKFEIFVVWPVALDSSESHKTQGNTGKIRRATEVRPCKLVVSMLHTAATRRLPLPGATALESPGPDAPSGMVRRLNIVAQRRGHSDDSTPTTADGAMTQTQDTSSISHTEGTVVRLANGPRSGNKETRTRRRPTGDTSSVDAAPGGAGGATERRVTSEGDGGAGESGNPGTDDLRGTGRRTARVPAGSVPSGYHGSR